MTHQRRVDFLARGAHKGQQGDGAVEADVMNDVRRQPDDLHRVGPQRHGAALNARRSVRILEHVLAHLVRAWAGPHGFAHATPVVDDRVVHVPSDVYARNFRVQVAKPGVECVAGPQECGLPMNAVFCDTCPRILIMF